MASEITRLLNAYREGDHFALDELTRRIYPELKAMARRRTQRQHGIGATTLVNETFVKLLSGGEIRAEDRRQFFGLAATIMRQVIVDEVRYAAAAKRHAEHLTYTDGASPDDMQTRAEFLIEVDRILDQLANEDERMANAFECRYFAGFSTAETAERLGVSQRVAERLWSAAKSRVAELMTESNHQSADDRVDLSHTEDRHEPRQE